MLMVTEIWLTGACLYVSFVNEKVLFFCKTSKTF